MRNSINLPEEFLDRMKTLLGNEYQAFLDSYNNESVKGLCLNTRILSREKFEEILELRTENLELSAQSLEIKEDNIKKISKKSLDISRIPYANNGYYYKGEKLGNHPYHHAGMFYLQDPGAMMPVCALDIGSDWDILDMCAAPGGKTTQLAMATNGVVVSNEIISKRCKILYSNIERMGFDNVIVTNTDSETLASTFEAIFDLVLIDAPCSGEGMFRKNNEAINEWSIANVMSCAERQREIIANGANLVKAGGYLLYSTCTFSIEENENIVTEFLKNHEDFEIVPVNDRLLPYSAPGIGLPEARRFYPHVAEGEGQFVALMRRTKATSDSNLRNNAKDNKNKIDKKNKKETKDMRTCLKDLPKNSRELVFEFLDNTLTEYDKSSIKTFKDNIVYFSHDFTVPDGIAYGAGVTIGTIEKAYIKPHHYFFKGMSEHFRNKINLSLEDATKYIHGESIYVDAPDGWACVCIEGIPLGGAKVVKCVLKNHYPKGLRTI